MILSTILVLCGLLAKAEQCLVAFAESGADVTPFAVDDKDSLKSLEITMKYRVGALQTCTHRT